MDSVKVREIIKTLADVAVKSGAVRTFEDFELIKQLLATLPDIEVVKRA